MNGQPWQPGSIGEIEPPEQHGEVLWAWDIARHADAWIAVAVWDGPADSQRPVIYQSTDGLAWSWVPSSEWWGFGSLAIASNDSLLVATNSNFGMGQGSVFVSDDIVDWDEHVAPGGPAAMVDVTASPERFVAVGGRLAEDGGLCPVAWQSGDGVEWEESDPIPAPPGRGAKAIGRARSGSYAIVGTETLIPEGCSSNPCLLERVLAWSSADGQQWEPAAFPDTSFGFGTFYRMAIVPVADGLVAATVGGEHASAWITSDGTAWEDLGVPFPDGSTIEAIASSGDELRIFLASDVGRTVLIGTTSPP